ncbi:MAG: Hsp20/alpha crystallin family protein [Gemmatales bacterium]|nr:Hsp20/alpha crystallin family protein [Gemmatales bacterium]MDW8385675.1 Hsp20/alpha crystallin family protein [Gemmatales bacterium]
MNIWTWRPTLDALGELQRQVDRLFDFTQDVSRQLYQAWRQFPAFNLYETPNEFWLLAPMPGVRPEDLDVTLLGSTLTIRGERKRPDQVPEEAYRRMERWVGKWSRTVQLPESADADKVSALLENGVLYLRIPKVSEGQPRQVQVKTSSP